MQILKKRAFGGREEIDYYKLLKHYKLVNTHSNKNMSPMSAWREKSLKANTELKKNLPTPGNFVIPGPLIEVADFPPSSRSVYESVLCQFSRLGTVTDPLLSRSSKLRFTDNIK